MRPLALVLLVSVSLCLGLACAPDCRKGRLLIDPIVCVPRSSNAISNVPFTLTSTTYDATGGSATCAVDLDGGTMTLVLDVTSCGSGSSLPIAYPISGTCTVPALPAGTYRLGNTGEDFTLISTGLFLVDGGTLTPCGP
jgi:hypothetical protein